VAQGTPEEVAKSKESYTARYLAPYLAKGGTVRKRA
jgi:excinuclease UvrABC ATPase subunit